MSYYYYRPGGYSYGQYPGYYSPNGVYYGPSRGGGFGSGGAYQPNDQDQGFGPIAQFGRFNRHQARYVRYAHGILAGLAFVILFPIGAIAIRIIPGRFALFIHAGFQLIAYLIYMVAFGLGVWLVQDLRYGRFNLVG
jgi:hypothetical protein